MAKWMVSAKKADFARWSAEYRISPVTARIIRNRDVVTEEALFRYLHGTIDDCHDPGMLPDIDAACGILERAVAGGVPVRVIGDYDVDGICATCIMVRGLTALGADCDYDIPDRMTDGYGINTRMITRARDDGRRLIVTVDNGIAATEEARFAKEQGLSMIVTDHHLPGEKLPEAEAVVDPCRTDTVTPYPFPQICGAVVAWKCILAFAERLGEEARAKLAPSEDFFLSLAALASVCDVMPLRDENRVIVKEGLRRMHISPPAGIRALAEVTGIKTDAISAYHLGFIIGPCLNASGRLDSAIRAVRMMMCDTADEALPLAQTLKELNVSRKQMTAHHLEEACEKLGPPDEVKERVIVAYLPDAHESVLGIVAGRLREAYARPVIALSDAKEGIKGSGRSVPALDMHALLSECAELFSRFGGHKMAAGMTLKEGVTPEMLSARLNEACTLTSEELAPVLHLDMELPPQYATLALLKEWEMLEPLGTGNERPLFAARNMTFVRGRLLGEKSNVGRYTVRDPEGRSYELMLFSGLDRWHAFLERRFGASERQRLYAQGEGTSIRLSIAYYPSINEYRGQESVRLVMEDYQ